MIAKLYENRKIANATHNMYAYRISQSKGKFDIYIICIVLQYYNLNRDKVIDYYYYKSRHTDSYFISYLLAYKSKTF